MTFVSDDIYSGGLVGHAFAGRAGFAGKIHFQWDASEEWRAILGFEPEITEQYGLSGPTNFSHYKFLKIRTLESKAF